MRALRVRTVGALTVFTAAAALVASPQQPAASEVDTMLRQAREEIRNFEKAGGKKDDPQHPVGKWVETLWAFHDKHPGAPDSAKAASESVHLLIHAERFQEAYARADRLSPDDPAWEGLAGVLFEAGALQKDFTNSVRKLQAVLPRAADVKVAAAIQLNLGSAWQAQKEEAKAKAAFEAAMQASPNSPSGREAEKRLYELLHLGPGQPAPAFTAPALNGSRISLADFRGKPLVIVFWASS